MANNRSAIEAPMCATSSPIRKDSEWDSRIVFLILPDGVPIMLPAYYRRHAGMSHCDKP